MDGAGENTRCTQCGAVRAGGEACATCGPPTRGVALTVLRGDDGPAASAAEVPLVRELKLPTLDHLDLDAVEPAERLPHTAKAVEDALEGGDLAAADDLLDRVLASVIAGPGHERRARRWSPLSILLWAWCVLPLLVFVIGQLGGLWSSTS